MREREGERDRERQRERERIIDKQRERERHRERERERQSELFVNQRIITKFAIKPLVLKRYQCQCPVKAFIPW